LGFVENLPFRDKAFDFVIASHVLEHSSDPARFLSELQRVAKAGYIEVPDAFMERINPYRDHRLEITVRNDQLLIRKKSNWIVDPELIELYEYRVKGILTKKTMRKYPFEFHVRYYWEGEIKYEVTNPGADASWTELGNAISKSSNYGMRGRINKLVLRVARMLFSQNRRNSKLRLSTVLACPLCKNLELTFSKYEIECTKCREVYPIKNGIPEIYPQRKHIKTLS
jgi:uncharacterized protein YbaR (Trm112 family)/bifunctional DNA-binding transcriptional regulator/antitoxin component of YhaV-PrlF toxin-antitoxin module